MTGLDGGRGRDRRAVAEYAALVWRAGWVANHDGNVSARTADDRFLVTPTATSKRLCRPETLVECDLEGRPARGSSGKPPSEVALHVGAYRARREVRAVIHAHPPHASAFALIGAELGPIAMPEVVVSLGAQIPTLPLFLPKDSGVVPALTAVLATADVALLRGNGAIAVGPDLETAYLRLELLEHYARIVIIARGSLGAPAALERASLAQLLDMRRAAGLVTPDGPGRGVEAERPESRVRDLVAEEVRRALGGNQ